MSKFFNKFTPELYLTDEELHHSQPFKFIGLPFYSALFFILYWFVYCPMMFVKVRSYYLQHQMHGWPEVWPYYFWLVALVVFLIIMAIMVCLWRLSPKSKPRKQLFQVEKKQEYGTKEEHPLVELKEVVIAEEEEVEDDDGKVLTPLTPREMFFHDLIESANRTSSSTLMLAAERKSFEEGPPQEFFIANVPTATNTQTTNIFMFVNANEDCINLQ